MEKFSKAQHNYDRQTRSVSNHDLSKVTHVMDTFTTDG